MPSLSRQVTWAAIAFTSLALAGLAALARLGWVSLIDTGIAPATPEAWAAFATFVQALAGAAAGVTAICGGGLAVWKYFQQREEEKAIRAQQLQIELISQYARWAEVLTLLSQQAESLEDAEALKGEAREILEVQAGLLAALLGRHEGLGGVRADLLAKGAADLVTSRRRRQ